MSDDTVIFTDEEREAICLNSQCEEHGDGDEPCDVPRTKDEAERQIKAEQIVNSASTGGPSVQPKQATAEVVYSDEGDE